MRAEWLGEQDRQDGQLRQDGQQGQPATIAREELDQLRREGRIADRKSRAYNRLVVEKKILPNQRKPAKLAKPVKPAKPDKETPLGERDKKAGLTGPGRVNFLLRVDGVVGVMVEFQVGKVTAREPSALRFGQGRLQVRAAGSPY